MWGGGSVTIRGVYKRESLQVFYLQRLASLFPRVAEHLEHLRGNQAVLSRRNVPGGTPYNRLYLLAPP